MCGAVFSYKASAVNSKDNRKFLKRNVVNELIVCTLQECGIYGAKRFITVCRKACCKRYGVLLGNADIIKTFGMGFLEEVERCPA